jgi:DNA-binding beta-propeller fold protein YncE
MSVAVENPLHYSHTIGMMAHGGRGFSNPVDVAVRDDGVLFVLNRSNPTQGPGGGIRVGLCTVDEEYLGEIGAYGTADGQFVWPTSIALDADGNVYVSDEHRHDIQVLAPDGTFLRTWGRFGAGDGELNRPSGLAIAGETVFVVDHLNNRVQTFTLAGQFVSAFGAPGSGPGQFSLPWGIALDAEGHVYVADWGNNRVQKLDHQGQHLATFGTPGTADGQLKLPAGVDVDGDGTVYIADWGNERVQVFSAEGAHLMTTTGDALLSTWGRAYLETNALVSEQRAQLPDLEPEKRFWGPTAVKADGTGRVFVVDSCRHRIQVYRRTGL